jgi:hypothetical protein
VALTKSDWNEYAGMPNEFFAAPGDRILHREIPEQEEAFWSDFLQGRNGSGFAKIDCSENRELLLQKYAAASGHALVVRSALNAFWRKFAITRAAFDHGFINPHEDTMVQQMLEAERPRDSEGRLLSAKQIQWQQWESWVNDPETSMRQVLEKRRTDPAFAEFYAHHSAAERTSTTVGDRVENLNVKHSTKNAVPVDVQKFAIEYRTLPTSKIKAMLSPGLNPEGPAAAAEANRLFTAAIDAGLL